MKKSLIAFLCTFIALPAVADNHIKFKASAIEDTINTMVPETHRASAADEYQKQMDSTTGKISVLGIYKVCAAAGFDINNTNGYNGCRLFINTIAEKSGFGSGSANQQNCRTKFNGIWTVTTDGTEQCVGKDGHKLVYSASCHGGDGKCIRDFASLQTQVPTAKEFIYAYGKKHEIAFTCSNEKVDIKKIGDDYIKCSAGGVAYEFQFDDLNQDPGQTAVESENTALCEMFGGKIVKHPDSSIEKQWQSCEVSREICNGPLHNLAIKIGHNVMYQGYCRLSRTVKETSVVGLKTLPGVDSRVFYNTGAQMRAGMAKEQTEEYLRTKFPNETYINCDPNPKILNEGFGVDQDYVMTCTVGSKQVDFIFHDLTEGNDGRAATGMDAMQCIISGGTFKGESCRGPTQEECDALDAALRAKGSSEGAEWDDDVRACIMGNAMKTYKRDVATGYIVGAVVIVGGAIVAIGTGGAAVPIIVSGAEMLVTDLAITYAIDANHRRLSKQAASRYIDFVADASECKDEPCALKVLKKHYATLSGVMNDLNKGDQAVVDYVMDELLGLIKTEYVACGKNDKGQIVVATAAECAMKKSTLRAIDYIDKVSEPVLIIASVAYNPGYVTARFTKLKNLSKLAKVDDVMDVAHMSTTDRKFFEAYEKYGKRSQTPEEFKAMFGGDYAKLEETIKREGWIALDEMSSISQKSIDKLQEEYNQINRQIDDMFSPGSYNEATGTFTDPNAQKRFEELVQKRHDVHNRFMNERTAFETPGQFENYSIPQEQKMALLNVRWEAETKLQEAKKNVLDNNPVWKEIEEIVDAEYKSGKIPAEKYITRWDEVAKARGTSRESYMDAVESAQSTVRKEYNTKIIPQVAKLDNKDFVVAERVQLYSEIVDKDPELRRMATRFDKLTDEEKLAFGQKIMNKSGDYTQASKYQLKSTSQWDAEHVGESRDFIGLHSSNEKTIYVDLKEEGSSLPEFMNTLAHEDGHRIDRTSGNMGMLGREQASLSHTTYSNKWNEGYKFTLDEQSSYAIGDAVEQDFNRLQDYRFTTAHKFGKSDANYIDNIAAEAAAVMAVGIGVAELE
ncbi:MAG: hypothetical protein E7011_04055 [Alphaproteobacteria bacterium]|nr:hypothetical protein [Alphaproteobacteria bacterium]